MTNIRACSQDNLPSRRSRIPVHSARFPLVSRAVVSNVGPPRMVSLHFCAGWTFCRSTSHVFTDLSVAEGRKLGPPRMVSLHFCAWWTFYLSTSHGFPGSSLGVVRKGFPPRAFFTDLSAAGGRKLASPRMVSLHFCAGWTFCRSTSHVFPLVSRAVVPNAGPPRTLLHTFPHFCSLLHTFARFCTLLHAFARFSAFYPKRSLLFLVNYRSLLAFREETF